MSTRRRLLVRKAFEEYWERGGFPEVAGLDRALRIRIHQEYWGAMLFRDLVERHDVAHPRAVGRRSTVGAHRLVDNIASLYSVNRLTAYLQSLGHRAPKSAVTDYVEWFEDAFFTIEKPTSVPASVHGAGLRRVAGPRQRESEEDLLRRPRARRAGLGAVGRLGRPGQRRPPAREPLSTRRRLLVRKAFEEYWERGGFQVGDPLLQGSANAPRTRLDFVARMPRRRHRYVEWFEDAVHVHASLARAHANPKKICVDHALARSVGSGVLVNAGHLLENLVFMGLRRSTSEIRYFKGANGREVDFVARMPDGTRKLVQVCESLAERTRKREVRALDRAMAELGLRAGTIVTRDEEETIPVGAGSIDVVPAWRFLLNVG